MGDLVRLIYILIGTFSLWITFCNAAFPADCDYMQDLIVGQKYYIYNPKYPAKYGPLTDCFWYGASPPGTNIIISCEEINLPSTKNCNGDKLRISLSGNRNFVDSRNYCGRGTLSLPSEQNKIAIELFSTVSSAGGRFICTLIAIESYDTENNTSASPDTFSTCDCGLKYKTKIVGGTETKVNEFPSMAGLVKAPNPAIVCGANIISDRYVLTAAHCLLVIPLESLGVLVGDWDINTGSDTAAAALYRAENAYTHPKFDAYTQTNDIAVVRTQGKILFSLRVNPICLPFLFSTFDFTGQNVTLVGWGQIFFNGPESDVLQKVSVDVVSNEFCQEKFPTNNITNSQICTYKSGQDACQHDSGGPVIWYDPSSGRLQQVGVISYGFACASSRPGVHSRVTSFLSWIVSVTSDSKYCIK